MNISSAPREDAAADAANPEPTEDALAADHILGPKLAALLRLKLDASVTHLYTRGIRRHIRAALQAGATREEVLTVLKLSTVIGIHALAVGMPILNQELDYAQTPAQPQPPFCSTPVCDTLRRDRQFNPDWDAIYDAAPDWLENFLASALEFWRDGILPPLWIELLCIAGDSALTHMYSPGTRRHIHAALSLGATREQILAVLDIVGHQGQEAVETAVHILDDVWAKERP
ncbi:hypothetical protein RCO28_27315 [Streptomyces sp. LHD-70]|uniref:hypothetical protein n=1 Tax=Streptomyces sp. LHD-70 TaxID=3072140 RepID=UPI00280D701B|nr:hypothetical protein [Streptomyces sp. LHD-70]MDQ8706151.1 hypothetical protein [Streptomyces sp. LHD-70]